MTHISRNRKRRRKSNVIRKARWAGYAAAGAATAILGQETADAAITHKVCDTELGAAACDVAGTPLSVGSTTTLTQIDLDGDGLFDVQFKQENLNPAGSASAFVDVLSNSIASFGVNRIAGFYATTFRYAYNMTPGAMLSANSPSYQSSFLPGFLPQYGWMAYPGATFNSEFASPGTGYVGVHFDNAAGTHYAWIRVEMSGDPGNEINIIDWAYGMPDEKILIGQTPEPGTLGMLAVGGLGLLAWRRKRAQVAVEATA